MILIHCFSRKLRNGAKNPKDYPYWKELIRLINRNDIVQVGVADEEQLVPDFRVNLSLKELEKLIDKCQIFITIDSFLQHLGWLRKKRGIVIFGVSDPKIFGHKENINLLHDRCYLRKNQFDIWENAEYIENSFDDANSVYYVFLEALVARINDRL